MTPFQIFNHTTLRLSFMDRVLVLFGGQIWINTTISVDQEVDILSTEQTIIVEHILPKKQSGDAVSEPVSTTDLA